MVNPPKEKVWYEEVTERFYGVVIASNLREATKAEIEKAASLHAEGKCPHTIIKDTHGWMYDFRSCVTCGEGLGTV